MSLPSPKPLLYLR